MSITLQIVINKCTYLLYFSMIQDARGDLSTIKIQIHGPDVTPNNALLGECFEATGLMILERNWMDIYRWEKWSASKVTSHLRTMQFRHCSILYIDNTNFI